MNKTYISYSAFSKRERTHPLRQYEIPVTHAVSLTIPTLRVGLAGYAGFASPALRSPEKPLVLSPPDRWWIFSALDGKLISYALCAAFPLSADISFRSIEIVDSAVALDTIRNRKKKIEGLLDQMSPLFFEGQRIEQSLRIQLLQLLNEHIPADLIPQYRALARDFFTWLDC